MSAHEAVSAHTAGSIRISTIRRLPEVLGGLGVDVGGVLEAAGVHPGIFDDPENLVDYAAFARLLRECERHSHCDHVALLIAQRTRLADLGLLGRAALCCATAGDGLRKFVEHFNLHISPTTLSFVNDGAFARLLYATTPRNIDDITDVRPMQLGAMAIAFNILQDLCGPQWQPAVVVFATRAPSNLRPFHSFFRAPLRFDSDESAVIFEQHWLDRPLPPVDPAFRAEVHARLREEQAANLEDFPETVRRVVRKKFFIQKAGMDGVANVFGMHRRTLDRHLQKFGVRYSDVVASVQQDMARRLLGDTDLPVQQIAESLYFSSAANFATAFRRWTGMTPSEYRRQAR